MDRSHPLLDRLEATDSPPSLKSSAHAILRAAWPAVTDLGDAHYSLVADLLPLSTASQLAMLEDASPHIAHHTNHIWRDLAINEFIEVRKVIEDGQLSPDDEPESWRDQYEREEARREAKMEELLSRMRGQLQDYKDRRKTIERVDGVQLAKARKAGPAPRVKSLMDKARSNTKAIKSIYAARRRKPAAPAQPRQAHKPVPPAVPPTLAGLPARPPPPVAGFPPRPSLPKRDLLAGFPDALPEQPSGYSAGAHASTSTADAPTLRPYKESATSLARTGKLGADESRPLKRGGGPSAVEEGASHAHKRVALSPPAPSMSSASSRASTSRHASFSPPAPPSSSRARPTSSTADHARSPPPPPSAAAAPTQSAPRPRPRPVITTVKRIVAVPRPPPPAPPRSTAASPASSPPPPSTTSLSSAASTLNAASRRTSTPSGGSSPPRPPPPPPLPSRSTTAAARAASPPAAPGRVPSARSLNGLFIPRRGGPGAAARG
ncbi:hypothetical protein JCM8208_003109 [Rhodotorula glutinis]